MQDDKRLLPAIRRDGCYFLTLIWAGLFMTQRLGETTTAEVCGCYVDAAESGGLRRKDAYILDGVKVLETVDPRFEGMTAGRIVELSDVLSASLGEGYVRLVVDRWKHRTVGHFTGRLFYLVEGNWKLCGMYDSYGISACRMWGELRDCRVYDLPVFEDYWGSLA